jgi:hypothetical protein
MPWQIESAMAEKNRWAARIRPLEAHKSFRPCIAQPERLSQSVSSSFSDLHRGRWFLIAALLDADRHGDKLRSQYTAKEEKRA